MRVEQKLGEIEVTAQVHNKRVKAIEEGWERNSYWTVFQILHQTNPVPVQPWSMARVVPRETPRSLRRGSTIPLANEECSWVLMVFQVRQEAGS